MSNTNTNTPQALKPGQRLTLNGNIVESHTADPAALTEQIRPGLRTGFQDVDRLDIERNSVTKGTKGTTVILGRRMNASRFGGAR